jgi:hypothetical protein
MRVDSVCSLCGTFHRSRRFVVKNIENNIQAWKKSFGSLMTPSSVMTPSIFSTEMESASLQAR